MHDGRINWIINFAPISFFGRKTKRFKNASPYFCFSLRCFKIAVFIRAVRSEFNAYKPLMLKPLNRLR